jgi:uncharacterized protein YjbI with pentapeptide repeats
MGAMKFREVRGHSIRVPNIETDDLTSGSVDFDGEFALDNVIVSDASHAWVAGSGTLFESMVTSSSLTGTQFSKVEARNVVIESTDLLNASWTLSSPQVVHLFRCRGIGFRFSLRSASDVLAEDCNFELSKLHVENRKGTIVFVGCSFRDAVIIGDISGVVFADCDLSGVEFNTCRALACDLRSSSLTGARGLTLLRGAIITEQQAELVSANLARECGLRVAP